MIEAFKKVSCVVYLWIAVLIFAASNAVTRKITEIGATHLVDGRNPISFCNVLFAGNLCALAVMVLLFGKTWNQQTLKQLTRQDWLSLVAIATLSGALAPALIFAALDNTSVTNVVLIGRLEPPLTLVFGVMWLKVRVNAWTVAGSLLSFLGVGVTAFLVATAQPLSMMEMVSVGRGELQMAIAAFVLAISTIISKIRLRSIPLGIFNLVRVGLGTVVFFVFALKLYGAHHFVDIFAPVLWQWMVLYGAVIVVAGQLFWFRGLRGATAAEATLASSFNPIAAIAAAYLILGEIPAPAQYAGGAIILIGIILSLIGNLQEIRSRKAMTQMPLDPKTGMAIGFKGI